LLNQFYLTFYVTKITKRKNEILKSVNKIKHDYMSCFQDLHWIGIPKSDIYRALKKEDIFVLSNKRYRILFLFKINGCRNCIDSIIPQLNNLHFDKNKNVEVVAIIQKFRGLKLSKIRKELNIRFNIYSSENVNNFLKYKNITATSMLMLIDSKIDRVCFTSTPKSINYNDIKFFLKLKCFISKK